MTIKVKVLSTVFGLLLFLALLTTFLAVTKSTDAMLQNNMDKLSTVEAAKHGEITAYLDYLKGLLTSLAVQEGTKDAFLAFEKGFYTIAQDLKLPNDEIKRLVKSDLESNYLGDVNYAVPSSAQRKSTDEYLPKDINGLIAQYVFIVDSSSKLGEKNNMTYNSKYDSTYMSAHKKYHKSFNSFLEAYSLYDIFMVDMKGNMIYTDFKEKDFATNLKTGVYSNTGIARAYKKALNIGEGKLAFDDFAPYEPSYNSPASFIATPIFIDGIKKGVLIFQMPVDIINKIMRFDGKFKEAGLGESGEAYLVGEDYMMRSNSRFQPEIKDKLVQSLGTTIGVWKVKTASTEAVMSSDKKIGKHIIDDYRGVKVLSVYHPIDVFGQAKWAIVAEIDEAEAMQPAYDLGNIITITSIVVLVIAIVIAWFLSNIILVHPLKELEKRVEDLAHGEGDLRARLKIVGNNEISIVSKHINSFIQKVQDTIVQAKHSANENSSVSDELARTFIQIGEKAQEESEIVSEVSNKGKELQSVLEIAIDNAKQTENKLGEAELTLEKTNEIIVSLSENINIRSDAESELADKLQHLSSDAGQVKSVLEVIGDIADQTNLLALNAAIEAARAGEHGRGFAVVADEVRKLAERTQKSLTEINATISVIVQSIIDASESISHNAQEIEKLSTNANEAQSEISNSVAIMGVSVTNVNEMVDGYVENTKSVQVMIDKVELVKELSTSNAKSVEEIASVSDNLSGMSAKLNNLLASYKS
ncbi:MAG: methyl-accepting chemotaxis protein [Campylobacterota bacterium]|nr:methyl-accepting chemotaxis protein [Campylobacterota bacterium]